VLAYIFWHHPQPAAPIDAYENSLTTLHETLREGAIPGFAGSATYRVNGLPWINAGADAYEDWYLVDEWSAIEDLNEAAVAGARKTPHDRAAAAYASGAGAIYHLRAGDGALGRVRVATWLAKPQGMHYPEFDALLAPLVTAGASLWRRQLVLGPGPEFCLAAGEATALPAALDGRTVQATALL
jgi:hypothetical protein